MGWKTIEERRTYARDYYHKNHEKLRIAARPGQKKRALESRRNDPVRFMVHAARRRAKEKRLPFNIENQDVKIPLTCPFLGVMLIANHGGKKPTPNSPTLDRIVPELGYVKGNVRVISFLANAMKRDATAEQLRHFAMTVLLEQGAVESELLNVLHARLESVP